MTGDQGTVAGSVTADSAPAAAVRRLSGPPFLLGAVIAASGVTGGGLLLHEGTGLLRAAVAILALQCGALAAGIWAAEVDGPPARDVRGWWLATLAALTLAGAVTAVWQLRGLPALPLAQGVIATLLMGLPQVALGGLAGRVAVDRGGTAVVLMGAAVGFLGAGALLLPRVAPVVVYGGCVAVVGLAGAMQSTVPQRDGPGAIRPGEVA